MGVLGAQNVEKTYCSREREQYYYKAGELMENTKYVATHEYASFTASAFGRSMIYTLMSTFALIFFTDAVGIDPIQAGILILVARIFDAFNDPIMGIVVDKTQTKWGKFRPYLYSLPRL